LLMRYTDNIFINSYILTIGIDFRVKKIMREDQPLTISIWDAAGTERFRSILPSYYRGCHGVLLCFDMTDRSSFERVIYWLSQIDIHAPTTIKKVLVATKCDLSLSQHQIKLSEVEAMSKEFSVPFFLTSSKTGSQVEQAFQNLIDRTQAPQKLNSVNLHTNTNADNKCTACVK